MLWTECIGCGGRMDFVAGQTHCQTCITDMLRPVPGAAPGCTCGECQAARKAFPVEIPDNAQEKIFELPRGKIRRKIDLGE